MKRKRLTLKTLLQIVLAVIASAILWLIGNICAVFYLESRVERPTGAEVVVTHELNENDLSTGP